MRPNSDLIITTALHSCAALLIFLLLGAAILPIAGALPGIEQGVIFGLLVVLYTIEGGYRRRRKRPIMRVSISVLTMFLTFRYLDWRITQTLPYGFGTVNLSLGIILILAELHAIISSTIGQIINVLPLDRAGQDSPAPSPDYPTVDVLIPTYNEDPALVETTIIAATQFDYPRSRYRVYVLDDGGTSVKLATPGIVGAAARERAATLQNIAEAYGATYLTRAENIRAKAGNINHALPYIDGDLILVLDCDHVPTRDFLDRTVGFFKEDPKLFLLQTPHNFVTPDPIERNLMTSQIMPTENDLFYGVVQPGLDFWGASFFCGSAALLRRSVLNEIGGLSGASITEDAETTLKAMRRGYRTAFYDRPMVSALQPETFTGFILQRVRWAQGMMQIFMLDNVWFKSGLTFMQRLLFTNFAFYWLFPIARMILLAMPPLFLLFGFKIADTTPLQLVLYALPYYFASLLNSQYFYGRVRWPFMSQIYETAQTIFLSIATMFVLFNPRKPTFKVTPKTEVLNEDFISKLSWPFYCLLGGAVLSLGVGIWRAVTEPQLRWALIFVGIWELLDVLTILGVIGALAERRQVRLMARVNRQETVRIRIKDTEWREAETYNLSQYGAGIVLPSGLEVEAGDPVEMIFNDPWASLVGTARYFSDIKGSQILGVQYQLGSLQDTRLAVATAFGSSTSLVETANLRHKGVSIPYGFGFLMKVGIMGAGRHLAVLTATLARNVLLKWQIWMLIILRWRVRMGGS
jgi:cellulose synthase (UDP-forming)